MIEWSHTLQNSEVLKVKYSNHTLMIFTFL